jgi:hypothetical protein
MRNTGIYDQAVHDLMARSPDIEAVGIPFLGDLGMSASYMSFLTAFIFVAYCLPS